MGGSRTRIALVAITLAGLMLRVAGLGHQCLWGDELWTYLATRNGVGGVMPVIQYDVHPPLYYMLQAPLCSLFGTGEASLRLVALIAGVATIPTAYGLATSLYDRRTGLIAALIFAVAPPLVWYSQEARGYSLLTLLVLLATWALVVGVRAPAWRWRPWIAYALCLAGALYTHNMAVLAIGAHGAMLLVLAEPGCRWQAIGRFAAGLGGALAAWAPWLPEVLRQTKMPNYMWMPAPTVRELMETPHFGLFGLSLPVSQRLAHIAVVGALVLAASATWRRPRSTLALIGACVAPVLFLWLVSVVKQPLFGYRVLVPYVVAGLLLPLAQGLAQLGARARLAGVATVAGALALVSASYATSTFKQDWRAGMARIAAESAPGDRILIHAEVEDHYAYYAVPGRRAQTLSRNPAKAVTNRRVWLIWNEWSGEQQRARELVASGRSACAGWVLDGHMHSRYRVELFAAPGQGCDAPAPPNQLSASAAPTADRIIRRSASR